MVGWVAVAVAVAILAVVYARKMVSPVRLLLALHLAAVAFALLELAQTKHDNWFISSAAGVAAFLLRASSRIARCTSSGRPRANLTEFYLWMSFGGVLGGLFCGADRAASIFTEVFEYPLLIALSIACRPGVVRPACATGETDVGAGWLAVIRSPVMLVIWVPLGRRGRATSFTFGEWGTDAGAGARVRRRLPSLFWSHGARQLAAALLMFARSSSMLPFQRQARTGAAQLLRRLSRQPVGRRRLQRPDARHDAARRAAHARLDGQPRRPTRRPAPTITRAARWRRPSRFVAGAPGSSGRARAASASSASAPARSPATRASDEAWRFFEIDPVVVGHRAKSSHFTFLANCQPKLDIVIGDARLTIAKEPDKSFDLIIVDAFSSDAVPVHLMTAEALQLYADKLKDDGVVCCTSPTAISTSIRCSAPRAAGAGPEGPHRLRRQGRRQLRADHLDHRRVRQGPDGARALPRRSTGRRTSSAGGLSAVDGRQLRYLWRPFLSQWRKRRLTPARLRRRC